MVHHYDRYVDACSPLLYLDVVLIFKQLDGALDASPSNLELTVVDATGNAVSVGGADTSVSLAQVGGKGTKIFGQIP